MATASTTTTTSYVIARPDDVPLHLRDRQPFVLPKTDLILRRPEAEVIAGDGHVQMAGAIEFQTQMTPGVLTDICDPDEIWRGSMKSQYLFRVVYDPDIQRGVKETKGGPKEFLRPSEIESMIADIDANVFECPWLTWNLRAGETSWVYVRQSRELRIYQGVATRPDTNHRHHAIIKAHRRYRQWVEETGSTQMGTYNPDRSYGLVVYTDDVEGEAHRFYVYNFKGWRVSTSTAHFIESKTGQAHLHTRLARELMERSPALGTVNVEVMTNHLSRNSAKMLTFGTLVEALRSPFGDLTEDNYDSVRDYLIEFLAVLNRVRPDELATTSVAKRQRIRETSVVDQAVLWHGYIGLAGWLRGQPGGDKWKEALWVLGAPYTVTSNGHSYKGDLFSRNNPAWIEIGVVAPGKRGPTVVNNRQARQAAGEFLRQLVGSRLQDPAAAPRA